MARTALQLFHAARTNLRRAAELCDDYRTRQIAHDAALAVACGIELQHAIDTGKHQVIRRDPNAPKHKD